MGRLWVVPYSLLYIFFNAILYLSIFCKSYNEKKLLIDWLIYHLGHRLPSLACCLSSPSVMWKHLQGLYFTGNGVSLKTPFRGRFIGQRSSELLPLLFSCGPFRVSSCGWMLVGIGFFWFPDDPREQAYSWSVFIDGTRSTVYFQWLQPCMGWFV